MDKTKRPFVIPPDFARYAEKQKLFDLNRRLLEHLIVHMPNDPISFLIDMLTKESDDVPQILVLGPPLSGKFTICKMISKAFGCVNLSMNSFVKDTNSEFEYLINEYYDRCEEVPLIVWADIMQERISRPDCMRKGWVINGLPQTRDLAMVLQMGGVLPNKVVFLDADDDVLIERAQCKYVDPTTDNVYHAPLVWPNNPDVQRRLLHCLKTPMDMLNRLAFYRRQDEFVKEMYAPFLKVFDTDQPADTVFEAVKTFLVTPSRSLSPFIPRILLIGPIGSGCSTQGRYLAKKYDIVHIHCGHFIKQAVLQETRLGHAAESYLDNDVDVPDELALGIVLEQLGRLESTIQGWVITGYPVNRHQAQQLDEKGYQPNRVFFLDAVDDVILGRFSQRRTDPVTGKHYHMVLKCPFEARVKERLQRNPRDDPARLHRKLQAFRKHSKSLQTHYPKHITVDAGRPAGDVFEEIECGIVMLVPEGKQKQNIN